MTTPPPPNPGMSSAFSSAFQQGAFSARNVAPSEGAKTTAATPAATGDYRVLAMRSNRFLGSALVEHGLITPDHLESANERVLESANDPSLMASSVLGALIFRLNALKEQDLISWTIRNCGISLTNLSCYNCSQLDEMEFDAQACLATWTIPLDQDGYVHFLATTYYLSQPVVNYWQEKLQGHIVWYAASMNAMANVLEKHVLPRTKTA